MAFAPHQIQGSYVTLPSRPLPWIKGIKLKRSINACHLTGRTDRSLLLKRNAFIRQKPIALRISAFKDAQNDELGGRTTEPKTAKNSIRIKETEGPIKEPRNANEISLSCTSEANESVTSSRAIHRLFKKWLTNLRTQSSGEVIEGILEQEAYPGEISETKFGNEKKERNMVMKAVWCHFLALDATIKIPLLIFIPLYLAVYAVHGAEVVKELTPLWVIGPFIVALYIKMLQWLFSLYAYTFKMTIKVIKSLPRLANTYLVQGKLKEVLHGYLVQRFGDIRNLNSKELQVWAVEKYLDFVESIWPYYYKTITMLKRSNLI